MLTFTLDSIWLHYGQLLTSSAPFEMALATPGHIFGEMSQHVAERSQHAWSLHNLERWGAWRQTHLKEASKTLTFFVQELLRDLLRVFCMQLGRRSSHVKRASVYYIHVC